MEFSRGNSLLWGHGQGATSINLLSGVLWVVWAHFTPPFPKCLYFWLIKEGILNITRYYLTFMKMQMLLYWLIGFAVSFLCQSLLTLNFPARADWPEREPKSFQLYMKLVGVISTGIIFAFSFNTFQSFCGYFFRASLFFLPFKNLPICVWAALWGLA